jgi:type III secretory pathway component EscS
MTDLFDLVREMLVLAVVLVLPLAAAALAGGVVGGLVVALTGLQDQAVAGLVRAASVVLALFVTGAAMQDDVRSFASNAWAGLADLGRDADG